MASTRIQPLDIPTESELTKARDFLREADLLVADVKCLFFNSGNFGAAARLKDIHGRQRKRKPRSLARFSSSRAPVVPGASMQPQRGVS